MLLLQSHLPQNIIYNFLQLNLVFELFLLHHMKLSLPLFIHPIVTNYHIPLSLKYQNKISNDLSILKQSQHDILPCPEDIEPMR